jgi:exopolyphosphatase/guanosine-5'-triphosphate,3'-diphosphate pyrophosphatase
MLELQLPLDQISVREVNHVAALDIGSNSFHLVVARILAGHVQIVHRVKQKVRLAEGLDDNNLLSQEAIERGMEALKLVAETLQGLHPESVRIVATYTLRRASNYQEFAEKARHILSYPIEVISGIEEARLIYSGVAHTQVDDGQRLVIDMGGGSTECIIGEGFKPLLMRSLQMGCVSFTQKFFVKKELKREYFEKAITAATQRIEMVDSRYQELGWQSCIGTSGTIRNILSLVEQINPTSVGSIHLTDLEQLITICCEAGSVEQLPFSNIQAERLTVFAAGLAILTAIFKSFKIETMSYSPAALREGVLYELEDQLNHKEDIRERTIKSLTLRYDLDIHQAQRVLETASELYDACASKWQLDQGFYKDMLAWSAWLHEVGLQINSRGYQRHSAYVLQHVDMLGFNQEQQLLLSTLVRFQRKRIRLEDMPVFTQFNQNRVYKLIALLRLSVLLNLQRQKDFIPLMQIKAKTEGLAILFPEKWLEERPTFLANLEKEIEQIQVIDIELNYATISV